MPGFNSEYELLQTRAISEQVSGLINKIEQLYLPNYTYLTVLELIYLPNGVRVYGMVGVNEAIKYK